MADSEPEVTLEAIKAAATRVGLPLSDAEAERLRLGVSRNHRMAQALRRYVTPGSEPAPVFTPLQKE